MSLLNTPSENKKLIVGLILAAALLAAGGFVAGRHSAPAKITTVEHTVTTNDTATIMDAISKLSQRMDQLATLAQQQKVHVVRVTEKDPNGTTKTTVTTDKDTDTQAKTQTDVVTQATNQTQIKTESQAKTDEVKTVTVINSKRSAWGLELQPGLNFAQMFGSSQPYSLLPTSNPYLHYAVLGVGIDHRLIGPLSVGAWANTNGAGGLTLRLDL
jgi:hypothetical protein